MGVGSRRDNRACDPRSVEREKDEGLHDSTPESGNLVRQRKETYKKERGRGGIRNLEMTLQWTNGPESGRDPNTREVLEPQTEMSRTRVTVRVRDGNHQTIK